MSPELNHADDSCQVNKTVQPSGLLTTSENDHRTDRDVSTQAASESLRDDQDEEDTFPEGGLTGWLTVFGSFCAMLSVYGLINSSGVFESYFATNQLAEYDSSTIGWIFSVYLFVVFFAGIQAGPIFDRHGPRLLVAVGSVLVVASQMILGLCTQYYQILLTYSVLGGIGGALLNVPAYGIIAHYFKRRRGLATGIASTAGSVGGIMFPLLLRGLLPKLGFAWTTRIIGFILLALAIPANLLLRTRLPPSKKVASVIPDWSLFRDLRFTLTCAGVWFLEWGLFVPLTFVISYAADHGQDATSAYILLVYLNVGSFFGRFLPGFIADKIGRFNVIILTITLCVITELVFWLPAGNNKALLIAFVVTFGFASGSNLGLYPVCLGQLCDSRDYGRVYSTSLMVGSFGTLTSLPIGGALRDVGDFDQGWLALILFSALSYAVAMSCFLGVRVLAVSWGVKKVF
ncbi:major facilitator superfamily domain-containing protein [Truncatella angustata]|uniref:Major facilitator superfamily domain-containing protein n=1 Tax=Truncatella angustata TaxID=152316 RepID=A0A9P8UUH2_9PEZI|nr:major facilitator superfamily domain-containing protein [Truncatella angustata]KAH6658411.1 major facilitator superfamily domain-containing protein [Truncatella angustata]